jgi:DNA replication protein DnaC
LKLPHLSDEQAHEVSQRARIRGISIDECPTCKSKPDEYWERTSGSYRLFGEEYPCNCEEQLNLRKHYLLANIPDQYMMLDWDRDYLGPEDVKENVALYLDRWDDFKHAGMGLEFGGKTLGTGKTFAATHIGKTLVKSGEDVFFVCFDDVLDALKKEDTKIEQRLRETNVIILDEVKPPHTDKQKSFFANRFESLIRHRTNWNGVTVLTTNLSQDEIKHHYPRPYSLLSAKQMRIDMTGVDARLDQVPRIELELIQNGERRPIS